jgi:HlyD family secretion protein
VQTKDERIKEVFEVEVTVPNPEYILKPGIPADVVISSKVQSPEPK